MRILIILLFVSFNSFGQLSYSDIMSINSAKQFKKVMIENYYEFDSEDDEVVIYGLNIQRDSIEGNKSSNWAFYNTNSDAFAIQISRQNALAGLLEFALEADEEIISLYDEVLEDVKNNCVYYDFITIEEEGTYDFVCYSCSESKYKGKIGFMISEGMGYIRHFPNE